jgi:hypothetical protein
MKTYPAVSRTAEVAFKLALTAGRNRRLSPLPGVPRWINKIYARKASAAPERMALKT